MIMHLPRSRTSPERHGDLSRSMSSSARRWRGMASGAATERIGRTPAGHLGEH
jgi:hypothetical protein